MKKKWYGGMFIVLVVIVAIWIGPKIQSNFENVDWNILKNNNRVETKATNKAVVSRVVDGDTIELASGEKLRYIGMNTPETKDPRKEVECFGSEAFEFNKKLVEGREIIMERDVSDKDKYGRLLRYVWIDGLLINDELVRRGYASVATYPPDVKYNERLLDAEKRAKENRLGLWEKCIK